MKRDSDSVTRRGVSLIPDSAVFGFAMQRYIPHVWSDDGA